MKTLAAFQLIFLALACLNGGQLTLQWQDNSSDEEGFIVERSQGATGPFVEIGTVPRNQTTYADESVTAGIQYFYRVRAFDQTQPEGSAPSNIASGIARLSQEIAFAALEPKTYGDGPFLLSATAESGEDVSYSSSNPSVATIGGINGNEVVLVGAGMTTITASQAGNLFYLPAPGKTRELVVHKAPLKAKAENESKNFGMDNPSFNATIGGIVNGETLETTEVPATEQNWYFYRNKAERRMRGGMPLEMGAKCLLRGVRRPEISGWDGAQW